jgi:hypothetical protein
MPTVVLGKNTAPRFWTSHQMCIVGFPFDQEPGSPYIGGHNQELPPFMRHQVELPDHVYRIAQEAAAREGITPEEWIAQTLSRAVAPVPSDKAGAEERPVREVLRGLVGSFDSSQEVYSGRQISPMAEMVADKLQRQGIEAPWRRQR